jgi:amino acid adenylation domain-containing protein
VAQAEIDSTAAGESYIFPTSFAQQRLWFLDELEPGSPAYNLPGALRLEGDLNVEALERSINEIVARHESLRTTFTSAEGKPLQVVSPFAPSELKVTRLGHVPAEAREARLRQLVKDEAKRPFDLKTGPLLRASLVELGPRDHVLLFTMHHIISDGWSKSVLVREVAALYEAFSAGRPSPLEELPVQYADYAVWQREWLEGAHVEGQLAYWREQLAGLPPVLDLPTDRPRPAVQTYRGAKVKGEVGREVTAGLQALSRREGVTLYMTLLAAFQTLLSRYTGQQDIAVGSPIAGRGRLNTEGLIGFFVNTLVLRGDLSGDPSFRELLGRVRESVLGAYAHQDVPFERVVEELQPARSLSHSPLFQVMLTLHNEPREVLELDGLRISSQGQDGVSAKFDLTLSASEREGRLVLGLAYNTDLFTEATAARMLGHFERLLTEAVANPDGKAGRYEILTAAERRHLLEELNDTAREYPVGRCIHQLFEEQVDLTPERAALVCDGAKLTYRELNKRANQLAHCLRERGVVPGVVVGVMAERTPELIVALLGVLKAGGAYLPLDPQYPRERLRFMLEDAQAPILLTQQELADRIPYDESRLIFLDSEWDMIAHHVVGNPPASATERDLAYLIYTSGSTGRPKGVAIEHHSAAVLLYWAQELFEPEELSGTLAATSVCFDLSVFEIFAPLSCGGTVLLARDALHLPTLAARESVTLINTVPSAMAELVRQGAVPASARTVNLAGEVLKNELAQKVYKQAGVRRVFNLYGPSEDTTYSTWALVEKGSGREPTIGRPIPNTRAYVLDRRMNPCPLGVPGELHLGGEGLARDYLRRPALTAEKFVPDYLSGEAGARLYRTGDLVRWLPSGELEYLGRIDHQVKVRGFRIELGEIEAALLAQPGVRQAAVMAREVAAGDGEKQLVGYVVREEGSTGDVRAGLRGLLPEYMVPQWVVELEALPLTPNGKLDRNALPAPEATRSKERVAPRTETETALHAIWCEVLGLEQVSVDESFFELGGHSLLATRVMSRVRSGLGAEVPLRRLFEAVTIEKLALAVDEARAQGVKEQGPALTRVDRSRFRAGGATGQQPGQ